MYGKILAGAVALLISLLAGQQASAKVFVYTGDLTSPDASGTGSKSWNIPFGTSGNVSLRFELLDGDGVLEGLSFVKVRRDNVDFVGGGGSTQDWYLDVPVTNVGPGLYEANTDVVWRYPGGYACAAQGCGYYSRYNTELFFSVNFKAEAPMAYRLTATAPIPEPATWAMMIVGFGLSGAALRRRREVALRA